MTRPGVKLIDEAFLPGPVWGEGDDFAYQVEKFLAPYDDDGLRRFSKKWLSKCDGKNLPGWRTLELHRDSHVAENSYVLDFEEVPARYFMRYAGNALVANAGTELMGGHLDDLASGSVLEKWNAANRYVREEHGIIATSFDLSFVNRDFKIVTVISFPLPEEDAPSATLGYYIWNR